MRTDLAERINTEVTAARELRTKAEKHVADGGAVVDAEWLGFIQQSNGHLDVADRLKLLATNEENDAKIEAWSKEPDASKDSPIVEYTRRALEDGDGTATPEYRAAFTKYVRNFARKNYDPSDEIRTLSIASDGAGGYTVPADHRAQLLARLPAISELLSLCTMVPTSRDIVDWPRLRPNTTSGLGSIYTSAFVGTMGAEVPASGTGNNEPVFGMFQIPVKKARSESRPSMDLAADSEFDLMSFLMGDGSVNMALLREAQVVSGTGVGANVKGLIAYSGGASNTDEGLVTGVDISGSTADQVSNTIADIGSATKLMDLFYAVPRQYRQLPSFRAVMNSQTEKAIRKLVDANGNFIWRAGFAGRQNDIFDAPILVSEFMQSGGTDANVVMIMGALAEIIIPVRMDITPQVLLELYAGTDQIGLVLRQRFGAGIANADALRYGIV